MNHLQEEYGATCCRNMRSFTGINNNKPTRHPPCVACGITIGEEDQPPLKTDLGLKHFSCGWRQADSVLRQAGLKFSGPFNLGRIENWLYDELAVTTEKRKTAICEAAELLGIPIDFQVAKNLGQKKISRHLHSLMADIDSREGGEIELINLFDEADRHGIKVSFRSLQEVIGERQTGKTVNI